MRGFLYLPNVVTLTLDQPACIGCGRCLEVCPHQVFVMVGKQVAITDRDACMECGACALNCPVTAIAVEAGVGCATGIVNEWLSRRSGKKSGCC